MDPVFDAEETPEKQKFSEIIVATELNGLLDELEKGKANNNVEKGQRVIDVIELPIFSDDDESVPNKVKLHSIPSDEGENVLESEDLAKKLKQRSSKVKLNKKVDAKENDVVNSEIEIFKHLESGPTEAELRRRQLIEVDPDEMEEKVEKLNQITLSALESKYSEAEQQKQIRYCREYLSKQYRDPSYKDFVESSLEKQMNKAYSAYDDMVFPFDPLDKIKSGTFSDDENHIPGNDQSFVELSDSDNDENDLILPSKETRELEERKKKFLLAQSRPQSSRTALLIALRLKVQETANENYCTQMRMQRNQMNTRLQIAENSRKLVELLKLQYEARKEVERAERRKMFQINVNANEEEFDDGNDVDDGKFLTEAEKKAILEQFRNDDLSDGETDESKIDGDGESDNEGDVFSVVQEELEGAREAVMDSRINALTGAEDDRDEAEGAEVSAAASDSLGHEETATQLDEVAPLIPTELSQTQLDDDQLDPIADANDEENMLIRYGKAGRKSQVVQDGPEIEGEEAEEAATSPFREVVAEVGNKKLPSQERRKTGNALFRLQLEQEEQKLKRSKGGNGMFDEEAEEEEEEKQQAGLGDFGFGVVSKLRESEEEANALKLQKGDLDHIVDDLSDGEGDEEAAVQARMAQELVEDRERTKAVITAVTEGRDAYKKSLRKGKYSFEKLVGDKKTENAGENERDVGEAEEEEDFEEMLQRGLTEKKDLARRLRAGRLDSDSDSFDEADLAEEDTFDDIVNSDELTDEQKAAEMLKLQRQKEIERADFLFRKQMEETTKMNRELRRLASSGSGSQSLSLSLPLIHGDESRSPRSGGDSSRPKQNDLLGSSSALSDISNRNGIMKRRTSLVPKKGGFQRTKSVGPGVPALRRSSSATTGSSSLYKGALSHEEVAAGYGMGMAMTAAKGSTLQHVQINEKNSATGGAGLFAAATGLQRAESASTLSSLSFKRSFSGTLKRRLSSGGGLGSSSITVASQQFVFMGSTSLSVDADHSRSAIANDGSRLDASRDATGLKRTESHAERIGGDGQSSLFSKLRSRAGLVKAPRT